MVKCVASLSPASDTQSAPGQGQAADAGQFSEDFHLGPENALLRAALRATRADSLHFNPVFLHGPTGVGKTCFLQALADWYHETHPSEPPLFTAGSDFARAYASAVELDSLSELRLKYRSTQLLILDGLEELDGKLPAQIELLHTVDSLLSNQHCVFVSARFGLEGLRSLHPGLRSRLAGGLSVPMALPSAETRLAVSRQLVARNAWPIPDDLLQALAAGTIKEASAFRTMRDLRNALLQLASHATADGCSSDPKLLLERLVPAQTHRQPTIREITRHVARYFHLKPSDLTGRSRRQIIVRSRGIAIYLGRSLSGLSFQKLGQHFGGRDHTTALHAFRTTATAVANDPETSHAVTTLAQEFAQDRRPTP